MSITEKVSNAISGLITGKPRHTSPFQIAMAAIADEAGATLSTADELKLLREQQKIHEDAIKFLNSHGDDEATKAWLRQSAGIENAIRAGSPVDDSWSRADYLEEFEQKREGAKQVMRAACAACISVAEKAAGRFSGVALKIAAEIEAEEKARCEKFAVPFAPSPVVVRVRQCADLAVTWVKQAKTNGSSNSPRSLIPYLDI